MTTKPKNAPNLPDRHTRDALYDSFARVGACLSHPTRVHLLSLLGESEKPVDLLAEQSGHPVVSVSAHLKVLREAKLIESRRDGRRVYYRVSSGDVVQMCAWVRTVAERALPEVRELVRTYFEDPSALTVTSAIELLDAVARGDVVLVDLRPEDEFAQGHLRGARSVPYAELEARLEELPADRPIVAYCRGRYCGTAVRGVAAMRAHGRNAARAEVSIPILRATEPSWVVAP